MTLGAVLIIGGLAAFVLLCVLAGWLWERNAP